jgi:hypothetical protein
LSRNFLLELDGAKAGGVLALGAPNHSGDPREDVDGRRNSRAHQPSRPDDAGGSCAP